MVSWRGLLLTLALLVVVSAAAGAGAAYWVMQRYALHMPLRTQTLSVRLPAELPVEVEILPQAPEATADDPGQTFPVRVNDTFSTTVRVNTRFPLKMNVPFRGEIPVDLDLPVSTTIRTRVLGVPLELPVEGEIPLHFRLPVDLVIPIDQTLPMKFDLPVSTRIDQTVNVEVRAQQHARIRLRDAPLPVTVLSGEVAVPLSWLSLVGPDEDAVFGRLGPLRHPEPEEE